MKTVLIYCEGQTEEKFIKEVLAPYLLNMGIRTESTICITNSKHNCRGGVSKYSHMRNEILKFCRNKEIFITTMFDYYGLPKDTPGYNTTSNNYKKHVSTIESEVNLDIGAKNFKFNLIIHEFEALLFSDPESFSSYTNASEKIAKINRSFDSPESINNSPNTAPSKRILRIIPGYSKPRDGIIIAKRIGIKTMMEKCPHFNDWIDDIINQCSRA